MNKLLTNSLLALALLGGATFAYAQTPVGTAPAAGDFMLYNVGAQKYVTAGENWGTHATLSTHGFYLTLSANGDGYNLATSPTFAGTYLGSNCYVDNGTAAAWTFTAVDGETNTYTLKNGDNYLVYNSAGPQVDLSTTAPTTNAGYWKLVSKEDFETNVMAKASSDDPVDATSYITNSDYLVNAATAITGTAYTNIAGYKANSTGSNSSNFAAEMYNKSFEVSQTITVPNGKYKVSANGFYSGSNAAYVFANDVKAAFSTKDAGDGASVFSSYSTDNSGKNGSYGNPSSDLIRAAHAFADGYYLTTTDEFTVTDGTLKVGFTSNGQTCTWSPFDNLKLTYLGPITDYTAYANTLSDLVTKATEIKDKDMSESAKTALTSAINTYSDKTKDSYSTEAEWTAAINAMTTAYNNANTSIAGYVEGAKLNALNTGDNTDLSSAVYSSDNPVDGWTRTGSTTPSFRNNTWSNEGKSDGSNMTTTFVESWVSSGNYVADEVLTFKHIEGLKAGFYEVSLLTRIINEAAAVTYTGATLNINSTAISLTDDATALTSGNGVYKNADATVEVAENGSLDINIAISGANFNFFAFKNLSIVYKGTEANENKRALSEAVSSASKIEEGTIPSAAYTSLTNVVATNNKEYDTDAEYVAAAKAINDAVATATALQTPYADYKALKANFETLENGTNYTDNSDAKSTFDAAVKTQDVAVEAATTSDAVTTATSGLRTAGLTFVGAVTPSTSDPLNLTFLITNASFANNNATGWTYQSLPNFQSYGNAEYYQSNFDINQTLTGMPKGNYELKVKAFQRAGWAGSEGNVNAYIYINDYSALIKAAKDEAQATSLGGDEKQSGGGYIPNNMQTAGTYFDKGLYENSVLTSVDGTLKFGFKCENGTSGGYWTIFDDFRLYYYGNAVAVTLTEDGDFSAANDMDNATVTLTRTFNANAWNTLVLPFDLTATQVTDIFGSSAEIATYTGTTAGTDGSYTLNFTEGATTISANVPVLIYGANNVTAKEITGLTIKTGTPTSTPTDAAFAFTGSYNKSTTLTAGDFFISSDNKFYKANGKESMKGLRAVFRAVTTESATAKSLKLNIGGTATGINSVAAQSVDDGAVYNVAGQRVSNSYKGLVIKNGKKYLRK